MFTYRSPRAARALAALILTAAGACAPDAPLRPDPARARRHAASIADTLADGTAADSTAADTTAAPVDSATPRPAELDSLFGALAPAVYASLERHRAAAAGAADAAARRAADDLAWPTPADTIVGDPDGAGIVAARSRAAASVPLPAPVTTRESFVEGSTAYRLDVRTTVTPESDPAAGTLTLTTTEVATIVPTRGRGNAAREETIVTVTVPACPSDQGLVPARVATFVHAWRQYGMPAGAAAPDDAHWDRRRESALEGEVTARVGDDAEVADHDVDLLSRITYDLDAAERLEGTARFVAGGQSAARLYDPLGTRVPVAVTGDKAALGELGLDERLVWPATRAAIARQLAVARALWRGGYCVQLEVASAPAAGALDPGTVVTLTPVLRSTRDGTAVDRWRSAADVLGASVSQTSQTPHAAPYVFAMETSPVHVVLSGTSRRGIPAPRTLQYVNHAPGIDSGSMLYAEETRYTISSRGRYETVTASARGTERVRTRLRVVYDHTLNDDVYYKVEAVHDIDMAGEATMTATASGPGAGTFVGRMSATLGGAGTTHNPRHPDDQPLVQGRWIAPYLGTPTQDVGSLRIFRGDDGWEYELFLRTGQIAPAIAVTRYTQGPCFPSHTWSVESRYSNATFAWTEKVTDPGECLDRRQGTTQFSAPYTYGAISVDQGKHRLLAGPVVASNGRVTISGAIGDQTTSCETARTYDPLQIASLLSGNDVSRDRDWEFGRDGPCTFTYALQWHINVPPRHAP